MAATALNTIALLMAEDAYAGDAQFTISVDGVQVGGIYTVTASRAADASQEVDLRGNFGTGTHTIAIDFLNDAYGGPGLDRNLYLLGTSYDDVTQFNQSLSFYSGGSQSVTIREPTTSGLSLLGVNISGAEYGSTATVGSAGTDYIMPSHAELDYYASKGMDVIRLPFQWERLQPTQGGALNATYLAQIDDVVNYANARGMKVDLDLHGFGYGYGNTVGSTGTPAVSLDDLWSRVATHYAANGNVLFGIMNEPNAQTAQEWADIEQSAVLAIRATGATTQEILASGVGFDSGINWAASGNASVLASTVIDPNRNLAFEVHQYLDSDSSGTATDITSMTDGPERLAGVTDWASSNGVRLFLGEFGTASDSTSLAALDNTLSFMQQHNDVWQGGTYWAGGQWWGNYPFSIEPTNGVDAAQMGVLTRYISGAVVPIDFAPITPAITVSTTTTVSNTTVSNTTASSTAVSNATVSNPTGNNLTATTTTVVNLAVYRFFDSNNGTQFLTSDLAERDKVLASRPDLVPEGVAIGALSQPNGDSNAVAIYRFFDTTTGTHFYTSSASERDGLEAIRADLAYEGISFYEHANASSGDSAVYRFFDSSNGTHFYSDNASERATILATRSDLIPEGIAFYAPSAH